MILDYIVNFFAPSVANWRACKKIREKIKSGTGCNPPSENPTLDSWMLEDLKKLYEAELAAKPKFEDKAKTNIIGITISVTLIMGAYTLLDNIENKYSLSLIYWIAFGGFILSVLYMLAAGLHAIHVITSENYVHIPDQKSTEDERKKEYDVAIAMNRARNLIRNNYVFTSYECIRNSLFFLFFVMIIAVLPLSSINVGNSNLGGQINKNYYYSREAMQSINDGIDQKLIESVINAQVGKGRLKGSYSIIDDVNHLFIKYTIDTGKVEVHLVENYEP